ncbi:MAG: NmrA family NAD(P)-binding protein [Gemmatimonadaceae bacterium]
MITILGATGHTGSAIADRLLSLEEFVRVVGRDEGKLAAYKERGAEVMAGDVADPTFLTVALRGADAAWLLIPPAYNVPDYLATSDNVAESIATAVSDSGITHVVLLSSIGGEKDSGTGPVVGLHRTEERLRGITSVNSLFLRAGYFYENAFGSLGMIKGMGINGGAIAPDVPVTMVASRDIGEIAARALRARDFTGVEVRAAIGPRDYTMRDVTQIIGRAIGRPDLQYQQFPPESFIQGLQQAGFSANTARLFAEMGQALNEGHMKSPDPRTEANTGLTTFEEFVPALAAAYNAM